MTTTNKPALTDKLRELEGALLTHHTLIWLLVSKEAEEGTFGWQIVRGIQDSNDKLFETYEELCKTVTGHSLTDGHDVQRPN